MKNLDFKSRVFLFLALLCSVLIMIFSIVTIIFFNGELYIRFYSIYSKSSVLNFIIAVLFFGLTLAFFKPSKKSFLLILPAVFYLIKSILEATSLSIIIFSIMIILFVLTEMNVIKIRILFVLYCFITEVVLLILFMRSPPQLDGKYFFSLSSILSMLLFFMEYGFLGLARKKQPKI